MSKASQIASSMTNIVDELMEESSKLEETLQKEACETKPFKMSDYIKAKVPDEEDMEREAGTILEKAKKEGVVLEDKNIKRALTKRAEEEIDKEAKTKKNSGLESDEKAMVGAGVSASGAALAKHTYDRGNLTGRETLYHNTRKENIKGIKKDGFKGEMATDPNKAFTPDILTHIPKEELDNKVYFGRKKSVSEAVGVAAKQSDIVKGKGSHQRETLKAKVPTWKMKEVENPELLGAKNKKQFTERLIESKRDELKGKGLNNTQINNLKKNPIMKAQGAYGFKNLGRKGTAVIEGDVSSKYIKGHSGYEKAKLKEVGEFIKKNPKRFTKGVGQLAGGAALVGAGGKIMYDAYKQHKKEKVEKTANYILEEAGFEKIAYVKEDNIDSRISSIANALLSESGLL